MVGRLHEQRRHRADERQLRHARAALARDVARDVAAAHREARQDHVFQVERFDQLGDVVGEGVVVVAGPGLAGAAETAAVERDDAVAALGEEQHLGVPHVGAQRPTVAEDDGLAAAPVLVIELGAVAQGQCGHGFSLR
ncbi:hypothetical protein D9M69_569160 [compost metagenome]